MPAESWRIYPARSKSWWLITSASVGVSRRVGMNNLLQSIGCLGNLNYSDGRGIFRSDVATLDSETRGLSGCSILAATNGQIIFGYKTAGVTWHISRWHAVMLLS